MTYSTGTATDLEDLLSKLDTFAQTTHGGWSSIYSSNPDTTNRWFELKKGSLSFSSRYPASIGTGDTISIHHATGSSSSATAPGAHTADSGNGYNVGTGGTSTNFLSERCVSQIGNGPFLSYHFFADDTANDYIHCVVEITSGQFRHFGFGILDKFGDNWTGGEYVFGHYHDQNTNASPVDIDHDTLLSALGTTPARSATIRTASALRNLGTAVWSVSAAVESASLGNDTAGNPRRQVHGGWRAGLIAEGFGNPTGNSSSGYVPSYGIEAYYRDPSGNIVQKIGDLPDVRAINVRNFEAGEERVFDDGNTWVLFPLSTRTEANVAGRSGFSGIAYKKIV